MTSWLTGILNSILCAITQLADRLLNYMIVALNAVIAAIAAGITAVVSLLPGMPSLPTAPSSIATYAGWINWFFPVGTVIDIVAFALTVWLVWYGVSALLRWAKLIGS